MKKLTYCLIFLLLFYASCGRETTEIPHTVIYKRDLQGEILTATRPDGGTRLRFHAKVIADTVYDDSGRVRMAPDNREFLEKVIDPAVRPHLDELAALSPQEIINELTLYTFRTFQHYFGTSFYRWGGDIFDLDDPQPYGRSARKRYGLDCSGFVTAPYDLAVYFGLLTPAQALFSSAGYKRYCETTGFKDGGGLDGGPNRYRPDTRELYRLGREVLRVEKGGRPTTAEIARLRPGDIAGRNGHFGIIVFIGGEAWYLESGGRVVPRAGGKPVKAADALEKFATNRYVTVRRCLETP